MRVKAKMKNAPKFLGAVIGFSTLLQGSATADSRQSLDEMKSQIEKAPRPVWVVKELEHVDGDATKRRMKQPLFIHPLIRQDETGEVTLNLDPKRPTDEPIIDLLTPGTGVVMTPWRNELGRILSSMPCSQTTLVITTTTEPVPGLETVIVNPTDKRHIRLIQVDGCLAERPPECRQNAMLDGYSDFDFGHLKMFFLSCRDAMIKAIDAGKPLKKNSDAAL